MNAPSFNCTSKRILSSVWERRRRILYLLNVLAPVMGAGLWWSGRPLGAVVTLGAAHAAWLGSTLWPNAPWSGAVAGRQGFHAAANTGRSERRLWLTIDDGPSPTDHDALLRLLDQAKVKVSVFVIGRRASSDPQLVKEWHEAGHRIENHTWSHAAASTWIIGPQRARDEVDRCQDHLSDLVGRVPRWFRAPAGLANPWLHDAVERRGLTTLAWTARGFDGGLARDPDAVVRRIRARWRPGGIVLMHQGTMASNGRALAPQVLERLLEAAAADGLIWAEPDAAERALKQQRRPVGRLMVR